MMIFGLKFTCTRHWQQKLTKKWYDDITMFEQNSVLNAIKYGRVKAIMGHGHIG